MIWTSGVREPSVRRLDLAAVPGPVLDGMAGEEARAEASERALDELACELFALEGTDSALGFDWTVKPALDETAPADDRDRAARCEPAAVIDYDELVAAEHDERVIATLRRARELGERLKREGRIHR